MKTLGAGLYFFSPFDRMINPMMPSMTAIIPNNASPSIVVPSRSYIDSHQAGCWIILTLDPGIR